MLPHGYFVLGDLGFALTPKVIIPYDQSQVTYNIQQRSRFNYELSRGRVRIEQVFGLLKKIFPYLGIQDYVFHLKSI